MAESCAHLEKAAEREHAAKPTGPGCEECLAAGAEWVHLRLCLTCGHVGCCDESPNKHATKHFKHTHHPVIRSYEPGEEWAYCYPDDLGVEPFPAKHGEAAPQHFDPPGAWSVDLDPRRLGEALAEVRRATERLAAPLSAEDQMVQSMSDASPTKWHLAHTTWFFETFVLAPRAPAYRVFDERYAFLFNSYYESLGPRHQRPARGLLSRPSLDEVRRYRQHVDEALWRFLREGAPDAATLAAIELGLHHEQQHQELILTDVKHALAQSPLRPAYRADAAPAAPGDAPALAYRTFEGGLVDSGHDGRGFSFDNEQPRHRAYLQPFALASRLVTCGEWLDFMADGGYGRPTLWLSAGFDAVTRGGWTAPLYWEERDGAWGQLTLAGPRPVERAAPVCHVSYYEADAFARWAGARLPTEAEWEHAAADVPVAGSFVESGHLHPAPARGGEPTPLSGLYGEVWQWTASAYLPYPGFVTAPGALGEYNGKFMSGQMVLRGGSCASPRGHLRATYRNFFPPEARWQFSGLRLARDP